LRWSKTLWSFLSLFANSRLKKSREFFRELFRELFSRFARSPRRQLELRRDLVSNLPDTVTLKRRFEASLQLSAQCFFVRRGAVGLMLGVLGHDLQ
jgi:hypothetical protein